MGSLTASAVPEVATPTVPSRRLQRACACGSHAQGECESCRKKRVQRRAETGGSPPSPVKAAEFERGGRPLGERWRQQLEPLFRASLAAVRIHDDEGSHRAAERLEARAFTLGQHIHFASGQFHPGAREGLHLLAHEVAHTIQQRGVGSSVAADAVDIDAPDSMLERAADASADAVVAGRATAVRPGSAGLAVPPLLQRKDAEGTRSRQVDADTTVTVTRSLIERPCRCVEDTQATPRKDIFFWDEDAQAIGLRYKICHGKVQLSSDASIDYSDVVRAGKDLLRSVGSNPAGANTALQDAVNSATISASGHVSFTVSRTLDVTVSGESSAGTQQQKAQVKVRVVVDTANGKVQVLAEAGAGITQSDVSREVERFVRGQLNLGPVAIEVKFVDKSTTTGGASSSSSTTSVTAATKLGDRVDVGCTYTHQGQGNDTLVCGPTIKLDKPDTPKAVSCYRAECSPPRPDYTCRRVVKEHTKHVIDVTGGDKTERMLYLYDSDVPAHDDEFKGQVKSVAGLVGSGYQVTGILGYASPEASRAYNEKLGEKRAKHAHGAIGAELSAKQIQATLPAPKGVGELLGDSSVRKGKEAYDSELVRELSDKLRDLDDNGRLDLLGVDGPRRSDATERQQVLTDIQEFIDGKDADSKKLGQRARWEKVFPHLRRVEVLLHRDEKSHDEQVAASDKPSPCDAADKAFIDGELGPIPEEKRLPQGACS